VQRLLLLLLPQKRAVLLLHYCICCCCCGCSFASAAAPAAVAATAHQWGDDAGALQPCATCNTSGSSSSSSVSSRDSHSREQLAAKGCKAPCAKLRPCLAWAADLWAANLLHRCWFRPWTCPVQPQLQVIMVLCPSACMQASNACMQALQRDRSMSCIHTPLALYSMNTKSVLTGIWLYLHR
jgi:hypothetical protein